MPGIGPRSVVLGHIYPVQLVCCDFKDTLLSVAISIAKSLLNIIFWRFQQINFHSFATAL